MTRSAYKREARERVGALLEKTREMPAEKRIETLEKEVEAVGLERQLEALESFSVFFGSGRGSFDLVTEDPRNDDGEIWDEVGIRGLSPRRTRSQRNLSMQNLRQAQEIGRWLAEENEFVIGAMANRVSYTVGEGLDWVPEPKDRDAEDPALTKAIGDILEELREEENLDEFEAEFVERLDADGEALPRIFVNGDGLPRLRYIEPFLLAPPTELDRDLPRGARWAASLGVKTNRLDVRTVEGYWMREPDAQDTVFVPARNEALEIPHVVHKKFNVRLADPRGWPTFWPIRRNMARAEKLLRNMSWVAALQAAIALIKKYETGTQTNVTSLLDRQRDAKITNNVTGKETRHRALLPGSTIHAPAGVSYEAPVSSVNAGQNTQVLAAELRGGAASVVQPEYMFSANVSSGGYANTLVTDGPPSKNFRRLQRRIRHPLCQIYTAVLKHEEFFGRLRKGATDRYRLRPKFPSTVVRDHLQETQRNQIMVTGGAMSRKSWRQREALINEEEKAQIEAERQEMIDFVKRDPQGAAIAVQLMNPPSAMPPPGSTPGGPGGQDMRGNPGSPETAPTTTN